MSETNAKVIIKIEVPRDVYDNYDRQSQQSGKTVEELMQDRLDRCKWHTGTQGLYFDDHWKHELEAVLAKSFSRPKEVIDYLTRTKELRFNGGPIRIMLNDSLMKRLQTRKFGLPFEKVVEREVLRGLEEFCGMR